MSLIDGQLDIFSELEETTSVPVVTCPHCGFSWTRGELHSETEWMEIHTSREGTWSEWPGPCLNHRMILGWLHDRMVHPEHKHEFDLIAILALTTSYRISADHVREVITRAEAKAGMTA